MFRNSTATSGRLRSTTARAAALVGLLVLSIAVSAPPGAAAVPMVRRNAVCQPVAGTFTSPALTITDVVPDPVIPNQYDYTASGGDHWAGSLTGDTTYTGTGTVDLVTGASYVTLREIFVGTIDGYGSGRLRLADYITTLPPALATVDSAVTGGKGEIARVRGGLHFVGTDVTNPDPFGNGDSSGTYSGMLCR